MTSTPEFQKIRLEYRDDGVRVLELDDPGKRNAIGPAMREELLVAATLLANDKDARALVVTGTGTSFCAGADLIALFDVDDATPAQIRERQLSYYDSFLWLRDLPYPTVAAVQGHAIGAGLNFALACDVVIAGPAAKFGATFARIGLHPGGGCTWFLTERLGAGRALHTLLLGTTLGGEEAFARGLADVFAPDARAEALAFAASVAALEPALARDIKRAVATAATGSFEVTLGFESWAQAASSYHPGVREGIRAAGRSTRAASKETK
ncbi:enoyl-CoA hydratase-related protein [Nocardia cyriacigeorgica]|uniref:enoyl-CoA hydratase-related protein n=1 Tax=Nocardia cyriacigeorgica TaxID=135487 RepID=UPI0013CFEE96|nr:enoyl-CoA hydratase-related protein [Nocardia cyriacigeorgica]NEW26601.1 enoyl-CoA hydratase [Nocardia cyriacigeorgica]